jgi:hypothetical protein
LPGKNKRLFCGLPLWEWSLATAARVCNPDQDLPLVSSDDPDILDRTPWGQLRPSDLCSDSTATQEVIDYYWGMFLGLGHDSICLLQPTSPTRSDSLVRMMIAHGGQVRSVTNGQPNGQCWVYRKGHAGWIDIETERGHDIDVLADFEAAEQDMLRRFV